MGDKDGLKQETAFLEAFILYYLNVNKVNKDISEPWVNMGQTTNLKVFFPKSLGLPGTDWKPAHTMSTVSCERMWLEFPVDKPDPVDVWLQTCVEDYPKFNDFAPITFNTFKNPKQQLEETVMCTELQQSMASQHTEARTKKKLGRPVSSFKNIAGRLEKGCVFDNGR